ncbi:DNA-processing protein DprA [bacterium]|nr:DNA-processing protein DprA [FCB group bacterium]MBL7190826.1 DNA-processing protein DprA [bacterium]
MIISEEYIWFRLFKTPGIGPKKLVSIAEILDTEKLALEVILSNNNVLYYKYPEIVDILKNITKFENSEIIINEYEQLKNDKIDIIYPGCNYYPIDLLTYSKNFNISPILFSKGLKSVLNGDSIAIIGSRNTSIKGANIARSIAYNLSTEGTNIISGYAKGIDSEAHIGALEAGGTTTMVLSYGINELIKKKDFVEIDWDRDILAISQFDPNAKWKAYYAMIRNKLVCALSRAVIVIESGPEKDSAGKMSGTYNAAMAAIEMNIPLFVVDPNIFDKCPEGSQELIRKGGIRFNPKDEISIIIDNIKMTNSSPAQISLL